ncbi:MAG: PAC2 family protein [Anaerolineae bacterium]
MNELLQFTQRPTDDEIYMLAGWRQWADAGNISSGLPQYLIEQTDAQRIGQLQSTGFYLFQVPGAHHFLRPSVAISDGLVVAHDTTNNEFYYTSQNGRGLLIFLGDEPHLNLETYADAWLDAVETLGVRRVVCLGGVYGATPYDRERELHAVYSLAHMQEELNQYAVKYSNYQGGSTIGTYLAYRAGQRGIELVDFYAFVPAYDFTQTTNQIQGLRIDSDFQAWYEVMHRVNRMFALGLDLTDLEVQGLELASSMQSKLEELNREYPALKVEEYMQQLDEHFDAEPEDEDEAGPALDDLWEQELSDLLDDLDV